MTIEEYEVFLIEETNRIIESIIYLVSNIVAKLEEVENDND